MVRKVWKFRNAGVSVEAVKKAAEQNGVPYLIANLLLNRDIKCDDFKAFLSKSKQSVLNPFTMLDMDKAADRVVSAIQNGESIVIYGDYDVDGITATALLYDFLKSVGACVDYYIPDRIDEGYGINIMAVNKLVKSGTKLLITVDCGITAIGEVEFAKLQGMDVIITDHHTCKERIPDAAVAVVNPKRNDDEYEFDALAGVGVAFKLVMAVSMRLGRSAGECFDRYCDLAAIGTIADVVPLVNENRIITEKGLCALQNPVRPGIKALLEVAQIADKKVTVSTVAFALAPRLNAAGRVGTAKTAVELLLTDSDTQARDIAFELDNANKERQSTEHTISEEAQSLIDADKDFEDKKVVVLAKESWHNGVIGIVASKIMEKYYRPCILISLNEGRGKGSGRSIENFNLFDALTACSDTLINFGGHRAAAGLEVSEENIPLLTEKINKYAKEVLTDADMHPVVKIDCMLGGINLNISTARMLSALEPYGMGNEAPVFATKDARVISATAVGADGKHLRMQVEKDGVRVNCIGFGMSECLNEISQGSCVHIAYKLDINNYQGKETVQLILLDVKASS